MRKGELAACAWYPALTPLMRVPKMLLGSFEPPETSFLLRAG